MSSVRQEHIKSSHNVTTTVVVSVTLRVISIIKVTIIIAVIIATVKRLLICQKSQISREREKIADRA